MRLAWALRSVAGEQKFLWNIFGCFEFLREKKRRWCNIVYFVHPKKIYMHICFWMTYAINIYIYSFFICSFRLLRNKNMAFSHVERERTGFAIISRNRKEYSQNDANFIELTSWIKMKASKRALYSNFSLNRISNNHLDFVYIFCLCCNKNLNASIILMWKPKRI